MTIQFNRDQVQQLWNQKAGKGAGQASPLSEALADNKLTSEEYKSLKAKFQAENPGGDFDKFLADALDGQLDQQASQGLTESIKRLSAHGSAPVSISFNLNEKRDGYSNVAAITLEKPGDALFDLVKKADADGNGRIDDAEKAALKASLSSSQDPQSVSARTLLQGQASDNLSTITYDDTSKTITTYLGPEAPSLNARYKDVKLDLDLSLQDVDGITDDSKNDLEGQASGRLNFDWNGPLVNSLKSAVVNASGGYAEAVVRWAPAGDKDGYGPGLVIEGKSDALFGVRTRPVVIKSDPQGRLYVESPGFGSSVRMKAAEWALNKYAIPELQKLGVNISMQKQGDKIFLTPGKIALDNIPLSMSGQPNGELNLGLNGNNTRFFVTPTGLVANFKEVPVNGSTNKTGPQAVRDAQADSLNGNVQVGLNATVSGRVDSQILVTDATAKVNLDKGELDKLPQLPEHARALVGNAATGEVRLRGGTEIRNGQVTGGLGGRLELNAQGADGGKANVFSHFRSQGPQVTAQKADISLAGTDVRYTLGQDTARLTAETGQVHVEQGKPLDIQLFNASGEAQINEETLKLFQQVLNNKGPGWQKLDQALKSVGMSQDLLQKLTKGDSAQLQNLLKQSDFVEKLKAVALKLKAQQWDLSVAASGYDAKAKGVTLQGQALGEADKGSQLAFTGQAQSLDLSSHADTHLDLAGVNLHGQAGSQQDDGTAQVALTAQADKLSLDITQGPISLQTLQYLQTALKEEGLVQQKLEFVLKTIGGVTEDELNTLKKGDTAQLEALLAKAGFQEKLAKAQLNKVVDAHIQGGQATAEAEVRLQSGTVLNGQADLQNLNGNMASNGAGELRADQLNTQATYQDQRGTQIQANQTLNNLSFQSHANGHYELKVPDAQSKVTADMSIAELKRVLEAVGADTFSKIIALSNATDGKAALEKAGLSETQAGEAAALMWHPRVQELLKTSGFVQALGASDKIAVTLTGQGQVNVTGADGKVKTTIQEGEAALTADLTNTEGQTLVHVQGNASGVTASSENDNTAINADQASLTATGKRADGSEFATLSAQADKLKAQLADGRTQVETGKVGVKLDAHTTLDEAKVSELQKVLGQFKEQIQNRLQALGLSRDKFEQIINAFGREQLQKLFTSANPQQITQISKEFGISAEQVSQMLGLLNDQQFQKLVDDMYQFSNVLEGAETLIKVDVAANSTAFNKSDAGMLVSLQQVTSQARIMAKGLQGEADLTLTGSQERFDLSGQGDQVRADWGQFQGTASGVARDGADKPKAVEFSLEARGGAGHLEQNGTTIASEFNAIQADGQATLTNGDGSVSKMAGEMGIRQVTTSRDTTQPNQFNLTATEVTGRTSAEMTDVNSKQTTRAELQGGIDEVVSDPDGLTASGTQVTGTLEAQRQFVGKDGKSRTATASAQGNVILEQIQTNPEAGVTIDGTHIDGTVKAKIEQGATTETGINFGLAGGEINQITADDGRVQIDQVNGQLTVGMQTPLVQGEINGRLNVTGLDSTKENTTATGFSLDAISGEAKVKTEKLSQLLRNSPDALKVLSTLAAGWGSQNGIPNIFTNDTFTIKLDQGRFGADPKAADALSAQKAVTGRLSLPDLHTRLGKGRIDLNLENLTLDPKGSPPEITLSGKLKFDPDMKAFNGAVNSLVQQAMRDAGLGDYKIETKMENGQFRVKIDKWWGDGLVNVNFEGDRVNVTIDRAKLLGFISAKGLASSIAESQANNYLMDLDRDGNTFSFSLSEISEQILHKDNLQINSVKVGKDNKFEIDFAYTDTKAYQAQTSQRGAERVEQRLMTDPRTGKKRSDSQLQDVVEEFTPVTAQKLVRNASPTQMRRILNAMGSNSDDFVDKQVMQGSYELKLISPENRALMAYHLARSAGLFESVSTDERFKLGQLIKSVQPQEADAFVSQLSEAELTLLLKEASQLDDFTLNSQQVFSQLYGQLKQPSQRDKLMKAIANGVASDKAGQIMAAIQGNRSPGSAATPSLTQSLFSIRSDDRLDQAVSKMSASQLRDVLTQATPAQLKRLLKAVGNDHDDLLRKALKDLRDFRGFPVANRAIMAASLTQSGGLFDGVDDSEKQIIRNLYASLSAAERNAFTQALEKREWDQVRQYLEVRR